MAEEVPKGLNLPKLWNIVVVGAMNPRIHNPYWYKLAELISDEEEKDTKDLVVLPQICQFSFGDIRIQCLESKWEINTQSESLQSRIVNIACGVFEKLNETPVSAIGFNTLVDLQTAAKSVPNELGKLGISTRLTSFSGDSVICMFTFMRREPFKANVGTVHPSPFAENAIHLEFNSHHEWKPAPEYRNLTPDIRSWFDAHMVESAEFANGVISRFAELATD